MNKPVPQGRPIFPQKEYSIEYDNKYENAYIQKDKLKRKRSHN